MNNAINFSNSFARLCVTSGRCMLKPLPLGRAHFETQADAGQGTAGQRDAARETLRDTV